MPGDGFRALATELRAPPPQTLEALSDAQLNDLATAVRDARRRQADELTAAGENALRHVPRLLRGPVRRVMR